MACLFSRILTGLESDLGFDLVTPDLQGYRTESVIGSCVIRFRHAVSPPSFDTRRALSTLDDAPALRNRVRQYQ